MARTKNLHTRTIKRKYKGGAKYDNTNGYTFSVPFVSATYRKSAR